MRRLDLIGQRYSRLLVISLAGIRNNHTLWLCRCICGKEVCVSNGNLRNGHIKSCGCLRKETTRNRSLKNINSGEVFNRLTVERFFEMKNNSAYFLCKCSCGNTVVIMGDLLRSGNTQSCGCLQKDRAAETQFKHGLRHTRIYRIWASMMQRCYNPNNPDFKDYGGRNITVCPEWQTFEGYFADNGESYNKHVEEFGEKNTSADRFPSVNGNYEKGNFRWATNSEQARNTRVSTRSNDFDEHVYWRHRLSELLSRCLRKNIKKSKQIEKYFGCSIQELRSYIESLWTEGMSWENRGVGIGKWNIDHILGCNNFDFSKEEDRKKCNYYKNLRPMWHVDHMKKSRQLVTL